MLVLRNCKFVKVLTEGYSDECGDVLLNNGKIEAIKPCGTDFGAECEEMDLAGKTLMPGLIDMHIHLFMTDNNYAAYINQPEAEQTINVLRFAQKLLDFGYTTVRDCGDGHAWATLHVMKAVDAGKVVGPTIIPCGPILCPTAERTSDFLLTRIDGPYDTRQKAREAIRKGAKFIKLYGSASMNSLVGEPGHPIIEKDELTEAVNVANQYNTYVSIHSHGATAIDNAVRCGVRSIEHASLIKDETIEYIKEHAPETGIVPTLWVIHNNITPDKTGPLADKVRGLYKTVCECLNRAYKAGLKIGWGTDVRLTDYEAAPETEFKLRKEDLKYADEDIIKQATINSAKLLGMDDKIGTVKEGKLADLIVVDGDPSNDISVMYNVPLHVIKGGKVIR